MEQGCSLETGLRRHIISKAWKGYLPQSLYTKPDNNNIEEAEAGLPKFKIRAEGWSAAAPHRKGQWGSADMPACWYLSCSRSEYIIIGGGLSFADEYTKPLQLSEPIESLGTRSWW